MERCVLSDSPAEPRHHLLIGGTGRAGTSFLVRYLTELGLDSTLSNRRPGAFWDEDANAGLEEVAVANRATWPYVVKTPALHQFLDQILADDAIRIDAVVVPLRPLRDVAASRVILELRKINAANPWLEGNDPPRTDWSYTPGGCFMSLDPTDQARLMAVGFYNLVERLVDADIPVVLLTFPRLAEDPGYLFAKLAPYMPGVSAAAAHAVHARLADSAKIRVGGELQAIEAGRAAAKDRPADLAALNTVSLHREIARLRDELAAAKAAAGAAASPRTAPAEGLRAMMAGALRKRLRRYLRLGSQQP